VSKPLKSAPKFSPHQWGVTVEFAFTRIEDAVGTLEFAEELINEGVHSGRLKSGEWQISPDSEPTWRNLDTSDWAQRRVRAMRPIIFPGIFPGMTAPPPQRGGRSVYIAGPKFAGQIFICRVDLDEYYSTAAPPIMTAAPQSENTELSPPTTPAPEKQKPGIKPLKDWPNSLLAPEMVRVASETPDLLGDRTELVRHVREFLKDETRWEPSDNKPIHRELNRLLSRIIK
jgi:hypothetical protein